MKAEMLSLLCAKSMGLQVGSGSHDSVTSDDISHFLGTKGLTSEEYDFLIAKYTDNEYSRAMLFDDIFVDCADIFIKHNIDALKNSDRLLIRNFINLAMSETMDTTCPFCHGVGSVSVGNTIQKCSHCDGTGQFIFDDDNRHHIMGYTKEGYMEFREPYMKILNMIKDIEISALSKIGDD